MRLIHGLHFDNLRGDIYGGLTAAVVALPLALAFGVASGAGPVAGLYGAIFVGLFAALFGGTPAQVSGPTGPMTVVMAGIITQYAHDPTLAFTVVMMGGLFQVLFGIFKLGRYISLMPFPVISGFMTGIGCIIIILEIAPLFGHPTPPGGVLAVVLALPDLVVAPQWQALAVGILSLGIVYLMPARLAHLLPPPLAALVVGTVVAAFVLPGAPVLGDIPTGFPDPGLPQFEIAVIPDMVQSALVLALLGSIDSLLTSLVADNVTQTHHQSDRELIGQGIGNMLAGAFGAIPGAGATMRTVVNVRAGGRTPISGALHALVLLAVVLGVGGLAESIPHAVLAGILVKIGIDIIDWGYIRRLHRAPKAGVFFMVVVLLLTVFVDLITAVGVGIVLASLLFVKRMSDLQIASMKTITGHSDETSLSDEETALIEAGHGRIIMFHLSGPISFGAAKGLARRLGTADEYGVLILDLTDVPMIDSSASLAVEDAVRQAHSRHKPVYLVGVGPAIERVLRQLGVIDMIGEDHRYGTRVEALRHAVADITVEDRNT